MNKWLAMIVAGIIIAVVVTPKSGLVVLKKITKKIKYVEDEINDQTEEVFDKIESVAASVHKNAMK